MFLNFKQPIFPQRRQFTYVLPFLVLILLLYFSDLFATTKTYDSQNKDDVEQLLQDVVSGAVNLEQATDDGKTALMFVAAKGDVEKLKKFLDQGADFKKTDMHGWTVLTHAVIGNHPETIKILCERGADLNQAGLFGITPLIFASIVGNLEAVKTLLNLGAKTKKEADTGLTARAAALIYGHHEIADLLGEKGDVATQHQTVIKLNLISYLEKFSSRDPNFIGDFKEKIGLCNGLTLLWLYGKWLDAIQSEKSNGYNGDWFKRTIRTIVEWNGKEKLKDEEFSNFEKFISLVYLLQSPAAQINPEEALSLGGLGTRGKTLRRKYTIVSTFTYEQLCNLLEKIIYDNELIRVVFLADDAEHAIGLFKHGDNYYYYDSNNHRGEIATSSISELTKNILATTTSENSALGFIVSSFNGSSKRFFIKYL